MSRLVKLAPLQTSLRQWCSRLITQIFFA